MKIVFAGTPEFAVPSLQYLIEKGENIALVYTQPDRPAGRGRQLQMSPVKQLALAQNIPVHQPLTLKNDDEVSFLKTVAPDVMIVVAYGLILPKRILAIPRYGCINVHASLLPKFRGAAPIAAAILNGEVETGVSIMKMEAGLDTGPVYQQVKCPIHPHETTGELHDHLASLGNEALYTTLIALAEERAVLTEQDDSLSSYAAKISKEDGHLNWQVSAEVLERKVRAFNPWPITFFQIKHNTVRVHQSAVVSTQKAAPGTVVAMSPAGIDVACGEGTLRLLRLQLPGGRAMAVDECLRGHHDLFHVGMILS